MKPNRPIQVNLMKSDYPCMGNRFPGIDYVNGRCDNPCMYCGLYRSDISDKLITEGFDNVTKALSNYKGVYISPYTDAFRPIVSKRTHALLEEVLPSGLVVLLNTKQTIPDRTLKLLGDYKNQIIAQVSIPSLDEELLAKYEPGAVSAKKRLKTITDLVSIGIPVTGLIMPWLDVYSEHDNIEQLPQTLASAGVKRVIASAGTFTPSSIKRMCNAKNELLKDAANNATEESEILIGKGLIMKNKIDAYIRLQNASENAGLKFRVCGTALNPDLVGTKVPFKVCSKIKHRWLD